MIYLLKEIISILGIVCRLVRLSKEFIVVFYLPDTEALLKRIREALREICDSQLGISDSEKPNR